MLPKGTQQLRRAPSATSAVSRGFVRSVPRTGESRRAAGRSQNNQTIRKAGGVFGLLRSALGQHGFTTPRSPADGEFAQRMGALRCPQARRRWRTVGTREDGGGRPERRLRAAGCAARVASGPQGGRRGLAAPVGNRLPRQRSGGRHARPRAEHRPAPRGFAFTGAVGQPQGWPAYCPTVAALSSPGRALPLRLPGGLLGRAALAVLRSCSCPNQPCPAAVTCRVPTAAAASPLPAVSGRGAAAAALRKGWVSCRGEKRVTKQTRALRVPGARPFLLRAVRGDMPRVASAVLTVETARLPLQPELFKVSVGDQD